MTKKDLQQKIVDACCNSGLPAEALVGTLEVVKLAIFITRIDKNLNNTDENPGAMDEKDNDNS